MALAPQYRPKSTFSKLVAAYIMRPFIVIVPPKRASRRIPVALCGLPGTQAVAIQNAMVANSGNVTAMATSDQYPQPAFAAQIATEVLTTHEPVSITDKVTNC